MLGPWSAVCRAGNGHTDDGLITWFPDERILVVGDYLSELEIPFSYSSVRDYQGTLHTLIGVIEREQPEFVVVGHGRPHSAERALAIADEDLDYIDAVLAFADAGCPADQAERIGVPFRGGGPYDRVAHGANVKLACEAAGAQFRPEPLSSAALLPITDMCPVSSRSAATTSARASTWPACVCTSAGRASLPPWHCSRPRRRTTPSTAASRRPSPWSPPG